MEIEESPSNLINSDEKKKTRGLSGLSYKKTNNNHSNILSSSEIRLKKDIEELKKNQNIGKFCEIILNDYKKIENTEEFQMIVEFTNHFSLKFIFPSDYPFVPPKIIFFAGNKYPFLFNSDGSIILHFLDKGNWSPTFWISTLIFFIEKKVSEQTSNLCFLDKSYNCINDRYGKFFIVKKGDYNKRNWNDYLKIANGRESMDYVRYSELKRNKFMYL
jgi:ubiquitin-protein ligase